MALNPLNSSNLNQLALKGLKFELNETSASGVPDEQVRHSSLASHWPARTAGQSSSCSGCGEAGPEVSEAAPGSV